MANLCFDGGKVTIVANMCRSFNTDRFRRKRKFRSIRLENLNFCDVISENTDDLALKNLARML